MFRVPIVPVDKVVPLPQIDPARVTSVSAPKKATIPDVEGMSALINEFAAAKIMLARGPRYLYQSIQDYQVITAEVDGQEHVVACGALHVIWEDLAEIRSVAVHPALQSRGLGRVMVNSLIQSARELRLENVFVFTLASKFFDRLGFKVMDRNDLPPMVWTECSNCPKFYKCDEIAMLYPLVGDGEQKA